MPKKCVKILARQKFCPKELTLGETLYGKILSPSFKTSVKFCPSGFGKRKKENSAQSAEEILAYIFSQ